MAYKYDKRHGWNYRKKPQGCSTTSIVIFIIIIVLVLIFG